MLRGLTWSKLEQVLTPVTCRSFATKVSQLKMCGFSGETFKGFEVL